MCILLTAIRQLTVGPHLTGIAGQTDKRLPTFHRDVRLHNLTLNTTVFSHNHLQFCDLLHAILTVGVEVALYSINIAYHAINDAMILISAVSIQCRRLTRAGPGGEGRFYAISSQVFRGVQKNGGAQLRQIWHTLSGIFFAHCLQKSSPGHLRSGHQIRSKRPTSGKV